MQEWYLMTPNTKPNFTSGFENDAFLDWKEDAFAESIDTDIADTVVLYNYDLSKSKVIRGILQGNVADTHLKSMERSILVPIGTLHSGDYILFEDTYWIVDGRPGNNKVYEKATLKECQYKLKWQKDDGTIVERWGNFTTASKYDVGETRDKTFILTSNNFTIIIPNDEDSMTLDGKRVFIDIATMPQKVFKITRNDDVLYMHNKYGGVLSFIANKTELNLDTDRQDLRICDYINETSLSSSPSQDVEDKKNDITADISFKGKQTFKIGGSTKTLTGKFIDDDGNENTEVGIWEIITIDELLPYLQYTITENTLKIKISETDLANTKVRVKFSNASKTISTYCDFDVVNMI